MASPTSVNDQITDSVTQANVKPVAEGPAIAMSTIYQAMAHATAILYENAVAAQQQQEAERQAALIQGVMQIYSLDTTASPDTGLSPEQVAENLAELKKAANIAAINSQVVEAVKFNLRSVLDNAGDFSFGVRSTAEAMQASLDDINAASYRNCMHTLQLAATAVCLRAMLAEPDKADAYAKVLNQIRGLT
ncbi:R body protein RebB-like protein [Lysobacter maris]|uniref:R body protein RebB-like protein n=1 Tax=Marilutibacter maris TaxID=1605891 RepID=A0A2U9T6Y4_9GAMM|nr:R body protein RebB-like protein [Lysobacter maris]